MADYRGPEQQQKLELLLACAQQDQEPVSHATGVCATIGRLTVMSIRRGLITKHARLLARKPSMWGGQTPTAAGVEKLATACIKEWTRALDQMLRNWSTAPSTTGR